MEGDDGVRRVWVRAPLPRSQGADLRLALAVPEDDLRGPVERQFRRALLGVLALAAVVFVAAWLLVEFSVRRHAMRAIRAIGRLDAGNYAEPIGAPYPPGELGQVARVAAKAEVGRLVLVHINPLIEDDAEFDLSGARRIFANTEIGVDRLELVF